MKWLSGLTILALILAPLGVGAADASVYISEIAWAGSTSFGANDEWLELHNPGAVAADISGWQFTKVVGADKNEKLMLTLPADTSIPANGYFLISSFAMADSVINVEPDVVDSELEGDLTLSNSELKIRLYSGKLKIRLYSGNWQNAELIDTAGDGGAPPAGNNISPKASMERTPDKSWQTASASINLDSGTEDLGTPRAPNSTSTLPPNEEEDDTEDEKIAAPSVTLTVSEVTPASITLEWNIQNITLKSAGIWQASNTSDKGQLVRTVGTKSGQLLKEGLVPNSDYYFRLDVTDTSKTLYTTGNIKFSTLLPDPIFVINEIMPVSSGSTPAFIELKTIMPVTFFANWKVKNGSQSVTLKQLVNSETGLWTFALPLQTQGLFEIVDARGAVIDSVNIDPENIDGSLAMGGDNEWHWTMQPTPGTPNVVVTAGMLESAAVADEQDGLPQTGQTGLVTWVMVAIVSFFAIALEGYHLYTSRNDEESLGPELGKRH